jgi:transcriptional regulator with PAS, ATPase and Fis domain
MKRIVFWRETSSSFPVFLLDSKEEKRYQVPMIVIMSGNWRRISTFKNNFQEGTVKGCSSLSELIKIGLGKPQKEPLCVIFDDLRTEQDEKAYASALLNAGITAPLFFTHKETKTQRIDSSWEVLEQPLSLSFFQQSYGTKPLQEPEQWELVGSSKAMAKVRKEISFAKEAQCPIHIHGETGTGKEIAAHLLRKEGKPMVTANCSEFSDTLGAGKLFGIRKGAYTDATETKGLVEIANGGTLFLDEVEDLRPHIQGLLLRLIENGTYHRIGENNPRVSRFRLITASNVRLSRLVAKGQIRKDLFYRINGMSIVMPPLREHKEDIPELVDFYLKKRQESRPLDAGSMELLLRMQWKGNVRQLFSTLRQNIIRSKEKDAIHVSEETLHDDEDPLYPTLF